MEFLHQDYLNARDNNLKYNNFWDQCHKARVFGKLVSDGVNFDTLPEYRNDSEDHLYISGRSFNPTFCLKTKERYYSELNGFDCSDYELIRVYEENGVTQLTHYGQLNNLVGTDYVVMSMCSMGWNKQRIALYDVANHKKLPYAHADKSNYLVINRNTLEADIYELFEGERLLKTNILDGSLNVLNATKTNKLFKPNKAERVKRRSKVEELINRAKSYHMLDPSKISLYGFNNIGDGSDEELFDYLCNNPKGLKITYLASFKESEITPHLVKLTDKTYGFNSYILSRSRKIIKAYMDYREPYEVDKILVA